jgi:ADP-heptose:LPS heptosyltransferase
VAVLVAQSNDQLLELVSLKDYLEDIRIILILPNMEREYFTDCKGCNTLIPAYKGGDTI